MGSGTNVRVRLNRGGSRQLDAALHVIALTQLRPGIHPPARALYDRLRAAGKTRPEPPPYLAVWRSVRAGGDTRTPKSRRTLALTGRCVEVLTEHRQAQERRRAFRRVLEVVDGLDPGEWPPRELRHSFVSLLSDGRRAVGGDLRLVGRSGTAVTEKVYRKQIRPVIQTGAVVMDRVFESDRGAGVSATEPNSAP